MNLLRGCTAFAFLCILVRADQITLTNGDRLTGNIVTSDDKSVVLKTDYAGEVTIDRAKITALRTDEPRNVTVKEHGVMKASVDEANDAAKVAGANGEVLTVKTADVTAIRNDEMQHEHDREVERVTRPRWNDFWAGFVTFGLANSSGNSSTTTISTAAAAVREAGKYKISLNFAQLYATQSTTLPHGETANKVSGSLRVDRDLTPKLFVYVANAYDFDRFQNLDLRAVLGGGFGYHVWKAENGYFDVAGGGDWSHEEFSATPTSPAFTRDSGEATVAEEGSYTAYKKLKVLERFAFFPNLTSTGDYRMAFDATADLPITKSFDWNVAFSNRYLSNPPPGIKKNDTILSMGVKFSFDQTKH
jgi:putative salt-induced outer membrane protein YdiY